MTLDFFRYLQESSNCAEDDIHNFLAPLKENQPTVFPLLDSSIINKQLADYDASAGDPTANRVQSFGKVPYGSGEFSFQTKHYINVRKLDVLRDCVAYIFENKISEARKV